MGSKSNSYELDYLESIFYGTVAGISGLVLSGTATKFWVSLHTVTDLETGAQNTNEADYGGYGRVVIDRTSGSWVITTGAAPAASPLTAITFATSTLSGSTLQAFAVGTLSAGAGYVYYWGNLSSSIAMNTSGISPILTTGSTISED